MLLDHRAAQAQAQAHAFAARCEKGREQPCRHVGRHTGAGVDDAEGDPARVRLACAQRQHTLGRRGGSFHRLDGVARQVEQHLLDHRAVAVHARHRGRRGGQIDLDTRAGLARLQPHQRQHGFDQQVHRHGFLVLFAAAHKVVHALDDAAGALGLFGDAFQRLAQHGAALHWTGLVERRRLVASGRIQQVERARGVAGDRRQRLVELVAEQRGHLAHHGQARRGLQAVLLLARQFFDAALRTEVEHGAHPAGVAALAVDQRRLVDHDREALAALAHEDSLIAFVRRGARCLRRTPAQTLLLALLVVGGKLGRPVRRRRPGRHAQVGLREADHGAEGRIGIGHGARKVARAQAGGQRVLHRLAKGQRLGQAALGGGTAAHVAGQDQHDAKERQRQAHDQRNRDVRDQARLARSAVGAQPQGDAWQVDEMLGAVDAGAARHAGTCQASAVTLDQRELETPPLARRQRLLQDARQGQAADEKADLSPRRLHGHAQVDDLDAAAAGQRHEVGARERRRGRAPRRLAGQPGVDVDRVARHRGQQRGREGRVGGVYELQRQIAPLDALQALLGPERGLRGVAPALLRLRRNGQCLQLLHLAQQRAAQIGACFERRRLGAILRARGLVAHGQHQQQALRHGQQRQQSAPQQGASQRSRARKCWKFQGCHQANVARRSSVNKPFGRPGRLVRGAEY